MLINAESVPKACTTAPAPVAILPIRSRAGPNAAASPPMTTIVFCVVGLRFASQSARSPIFSTTAKRGGRRICPKVMATSWSLFLMIASWDSVVLYRCSASVAKATFSSQASVPSLMDSANRSPAPAALKRASLIRTSVIPISSSTLMALIPCSSVRCKPLMKAMRAPAAFSRNCRTNCSALMPATAANCSNFSPPVSAASCI